MTVFEKYALAVTIFFALLIVAFNLITSPSDRLVTVTVLYASASSPPQKDGEQDAQTARTAPGSSTSAVISVIPQSPEQAPEQASDGEDSNASQVSLVNINTATIEELDTLPGIGPVLAARIVEYREKNGCFTAAAELQNVSGIGSKTYEKLSAYITVD